MPLTSPLGGLGNLIPIAFVNQNLDYTLEPLPWEFTKRIRPTPCKPPDTQPWWDLLTLVLTLDLKLTLGIARERTRPMTEPSLRNLTTPSLLLPLDVRHCKEVRHCMLPACRTRPARVYLYPL